MRFFNRNKKIAVAVLVLAIFFVLNFISSQVRNTVVTFTSPFQTALWNTGDNITGFFGGKLRLENETLTEENLKLVSQLIAMESLERENRELRELLDVGLKEEYSLVLAQVIGKNIREDFITIRQGSEQGIEIGMPVITASNVAVGRVTEVFSKHAHVQLITAQESRLDVQVRETRAVGVARGQGASHILLDLVAREDEIHKGNLVFTQGEVFPKNVLVGEIREVLQGGADPFQKANLNPFFEIRELDTVFVITSQDI